jgi:hydroxyacylglutathione hydrolase
MLNNMGRRHVHRAFVDGAGNSAYLLGLTGTGTAALIDPLRDVERYLAAAARRGATITHVFETHVHADFLSGACELAARNGALIAASAAAQLGFEHRAGRWRPRGAGR